MGKCCIDGISVNQLDLVVAGTEAKRLIGTDGIVRVIFGFSPKADKWGIYVPKYGPITFTDENEYEAFVDHAYKTDCYQIFSVANRY